MNMPVGSIGERPPSGLNGIYLAKDLMTADSTCRNLTLVLSQDGTAALMTEFVGRGTMIERGKWSGEQQRAEITWTDLDGEAIYLRMIFELRGNEMVYIGPDPHAFGIPGMRLNRAVPSA